jgi:hypothetical protein
MVEFRIEMKNNIDVMKQDKDQKYKYMNRDQNKKHEELIKLLKNQGSPCRNKKGSTSDSSRYSSPPLQPPYNPSRSPQYYPFMIYPPRAKIELLKYNGSETQCVAWSNKAGQYLDIYNIKTDEEKIKYASMHLEGEAYYWYMWWKKQITCTTCILLKTVVLRDSMESMKMNSFRNKQNYNKKEVSMNSHINGKISPHDYSSYLYSNYSNLIWEVLNRISKRN